MGDKPSPTPAPEAHGPLIAYTVPRRNSWAAGGDMDLVLTQGPKPVATWTKHVDGPRFVSVGAPRFTADAKYAFAQYLDEQAGRYPYDGGDLHAELVWIDVTSRQTHEVAIPAESRADSRPPGRPGAPYALQGSTVVWQAPVSADAPDGQVTLMQLDLSQPNATPSVWRTVQLPPPTPAREAVRAERTDFTGIVIGAGEGRVAIVDKYGTDRSIQADRLFLVDTEGNVRDLGHRPTSYWVSAIFSPDGTRFAYETGDPANGPCNRHQVTVFDSTTGQPAAGFPAGPFDATPRPYFYGNLNGAVWWTPDGELRATAGAAQCPTDRSETTPDGGVWELNGGRWTKVAPDGTYRDYPLPDGDAVVIARVAPRPADPGLFIRQGDRRVHITDADADRVAVAWRP
jgi:hypothetical protein